MKIAVIGANGKVGRELCLYLARSEGIEVVAICRNVMGSAFLRSKSIECRICNICDGSEASQVLSDIDVVVICSFVFGPSRSAFNVNRTIVNNAINCSQLHSKILYMSSVRALGWRVDPTTPRFSVPRSYDRSKRYLERRLLADCRKLGKTGIALRLGHVYGPGQPRTQALKELLDSEKPIEVQVTPDRLSNVVHTITIADCVAVCARSNVEPGVYSLVNVPQWTWREVFEFYARAGLAIEYDEQDSRPISFYRGVIQRLWKYVSAHRETLAELRQFMPTSIERKLKMRFATRNAGQQMRSLLAARKEIIGMSEFAYKPMPEEFVPGLSKTKALLQNDSVEAM